MIRAVKWLGSSRFALAVIAFMAVYVAMGGLSGLDLPFTSPVFLAACTALFFSTAACVILRLAGERGARSGLRRLDPAPWSGLIFHAGLLVIIVGVVIRNAFLDAGAFELVEGAAVKLDVPGTLLTRERGPLAHVLPPRVEVALASFDAFRRQEGYAPDRQSRIRTAVPGDEPHDAVLDRAAGLEIDGVTVYQAIPTGIALIVETENGGRRSLHLRADGSRNASASFAAPGGREVTMGVSAERAINDPDGTGKLYPWMMSDGRQSRLVFGDTFEFGGTRARLIGPARWGGFTYARSRGMHVVFAGFALVLAGAALRLLNAGRPGADGHGGGAS